VLIHLVEEELERGKGRNPDAVDSIALKKSEDSFTLPHELETPHGR
jgi:hypothetical protein